MPFQPRLAAGGDRANRWVASLNPRMASGTRAIVGTYLTNLALMASSVISGSIAAVALQPAGRGILAAAILWPTITVHAGAFGIQWGIVRRIREVGSGGADNAAAGALQTSLILSFLEVGLLASVLPLLLPRWEEMRHWAFIF